ncbi:MAG: AAA family ATPase, partial [Deltaproteobacteria bacterium]|nr:AAA family ATPase [Deltaproteobacteria bacterium]
AMNNLNDISMDEQYGDIVGYTQEELEACFSGWIDETAEKMGTPREDLLGQLKDYYDGFCFDGATRLYNPFSIMQCLLKARLGNYWYKSGSPSFIVEYMKQHAIQDPETYRHLEVDQDFADSQEIERAKPESFLYQSGYLTIERREEQALILDYPNREVLDSISKMYLETVYHVEGYTAIGSRLWRALKGGDIDGALSLYNTALAGIPYEDFMKQSESLYRALFLMLLRGAGISATGELHSSRGRSDLVVTFPERIVVLEFKLARRESEIEGLKAEGLQQIEERGYAAPYDAERRAVAAAVVVADAEKRQVFWQVSS